MSITQELRYDTLRVRFKKLLLQFPVLPHADVTGRFNAFSEEEIAIVAERLVTEEFMTITHGRHGGVRYVRNPQIQG